MPEEELQQHWRQVGSILDRAYHLVLGQAAIQRNGPLFREFLEQNELGVAWQLLVDSLQNDPGAAPDSFWRAMVRAGDLMHLGDETRPLRALAPPLTPKALIHQLLYYALLEIRAYTVEPNTEAIRMLANLFHNLPGRLASAESSGDYQGILDEMWQRAEPEGIAWMRHSIEVNLDLDPTFYGYE